MADKVKTKRFDIARPLLIVSSILVVIAILVFAIFKRHATPVETPEQDIASAESDDESPEENRNCEVPGMTVRWKLAYCLAREGTDDIEAPGTQGCMKDTAINPSPQANACSQNLFWKEKICQISHGTKAEADACIKDPNFLPEQVSYGLETEGDEDN